ncbi:MAG: hypothetical protein J1E82_01800 [Muribaculaceae bacterium]|nr:hypothetical protein [Muribaculaceae bacterium]
MFKNKLKYIIFTIFSVLLSTGLNSCVDDKLTIDDITGKGSSSDEGGLMFAFDLTRGGFDVSPDGTHNSKLSDFDEEIVVNPDNFNVVFFQKDGIFLKEFKNQEITEIEESGRKIYYVKIPTSDLEKDQNLINYIRNNNFKIAVFANWAKYPDFETSSKLDPNGINRNNIFYITHCWADESYTSTNDPNNEQGDDSETLYFITGKGFKMGMYQDWVAIRYQYDNDAEKAIRNNYDVKNAVFHSDSKPLLTNAVGMKVTFSDMKDYDYHNVWHIWNFGGENNKNNNNYYNSENARIRDDWAKINNDCYDMAFSSSWQNGSQYISGEPTVRNLSINSNGKIKAIQDGGNGYGITLPSQNTGSTEIDKTKPYLSYKVSADGYIYVKCKGNSRNAKLVARRGTDTDTQALLYYSPGTNLNTVQFDYTKVKQNTNDEVVQEIVRVTGQPQNLELYAVDGDITIYEIDYVKSHMVQLADKQMINPANTPEGGISMYGIQDFEAVETKYWPEGTTFDLSRNLSTNTGSDARNYKYRTISLLRSVAKVEVLLPKSIFPEPTHMFLRTLNRFSRSAPMDVFTPTDILWNGYAAGGYSSKGYDENVEGYIYNSSSKKNHNYKSVVGVDREIENIKIKGFTYNNYKYPDDQKDVEKIAYQNKIAWLFGIWNTEFGWNWAGQTSISFNNNDGPYPRIFNTRINRTDYAHMIDGGTVSLTSDGIDTSGDEYYYYYAYVPEKNVTDPNNNATMAESPKVIRIEMRFPGNTDENLDDNASYRIYFTPEGGGGSVENRDGYDDLWEKGGSEGSASLEKLKSIYPVMRNHLYRFKVTGLQMNKLNVDFEVKGPDHSDVIYNFD